MLQLIIQLSPTTHADGQQVLHPRRGRLRGVLDDFSEIPPDPRLQEYFGRLKGSFLQYLYALYGSEERGQNSQQYDHWSQLEQPWLVCFTQQGIADEQPQDMAGPPGDGASTGASYSYDMTVR